MGTALIKGLLAVGVSRHRLLAAEIRPSQRRRVANTLRIRVTVDVAHVMAKSTIVVLAVKPQELGRIVTTMRAASRKPLVISIAAGITTRWLEQRLGRTAVIRAMPNTAARVGTSIVAVTRGRFATQQHLTLAQTLFQAVGETVIVPERLMNAVTAVSGSGPAYFFWLTAELARAGQAVGLPRATAARLARQTAIGSAGLLARSDEAPEALIAQVASKRGTTEAALKVFTRRRMAAIIRDAVRAAARRAAQLSRLAERE